MLFKNNCSKEDLLKKDWSIAIVFILSSRRGYCNIHLITTYCCSNLSIEGIELMEIFIICDVTHWAAWEYFLFIWKHKYTLPARVIVLFYVTQQVQYVVQCLMVSNKWFIFGFNTVILFSWCYTWVDVICIWVLIPV